MKDSFSNFFGGVKKESEKEEKTEKTKDTTVAKAAKKDIVIKIIDNNKHLKDTYSKSKALIMQYQDEYADMIKKVSEGVVNIYTTQVVKSNALGAGNNFADMFSFPENSPFKDFFDNFNFGMPKNRIRERKINALGSGFLVSKNGYIVTNYHVVKNATEINIKLHNGDKVKAKLIGYDDKSDIAVLKIAYKKELKYLEFSNSDNMRVGYKIIAVGNPFGLGGTVTEGIISAKGRDLKDNYFSKYIQTDAAVNMGNSGGPMLNLDGYVIGVNTAIYSVSGGNVGIGFAVPSNMVVKIVQKIIETGSFDRGWLGINIQNFDENLAKSLGLSIKTGVYVSLVNPKGPAFKAGLKNDDIIQEVDNIKIKDAKHLQEVIASKSVGDIVKVKLYRKAGNSSKYKIILKKVKLEKFPDLDNLNKANNKVNDKNIKTETFLGVEFANISEELYNRYSFTKDFQAIVVRDASKIVSSLVGILVKGDFVESINGVKVASIDDLKKVKKILKNSMKKSKNIIISIVIRRGKHSRIIISKSVPVEDIK